MISEEYIKNHFENIKFHGFNLFFSPRRTLIYKSFMQLIKLQNLKEIKKQRNLSTVQTHWVHAVYCTYKSLQKKLTLCRSVFYFRENNPSPPEHYKLPIQADFPAALSAESTHAKTKPYISTGCTIHSKDKIHTRRGHLSVWHSSPHLSVLFAMV